MASHIYPIPEVYRSVTRPVTIEIIRQVLTMTGINPNQFRSKMVGLAEAESVPGSTLDREHETSPNRLPSDDKYVLEVKEEEVGNNITPVRYPDATPIFTDDGLRISMKPVLSLNKTTISVVVTMPSRVRAHNWLMEVKRRIYQMKVTNYHSVSYHYPIPKPFIYYLTQMHQMREQVEPLHEDFGQWLKRCLVDRWTVVSNMGGEERSIVIQERQVNIYGWFDFDFEPEKPERTADSSGAWQIQFDYTFHYQRPDSLVFEYPLVIHNQLLPLDMIDTDREEHIDTYPTYQGRTSAAYDALVFRYNRQGMVEPQGIPEPLYDDWRAPKPPSYFIELARTLITIDPNDRTWAVSLDDISTSFDFKPAIIQLMRASSHRLFKPYESIFHIRLCRWHNIIPPDSLQLTDDLKLVTNFEMPLTDMWHVVVYILSNPLYLKPEGWEDIANNCAAFKEWLAAIFGQHYADMVVCNIDGGVDREIIDNILDNVREDSNDNTVMGFPRGGIKTVGVYDILADNYLMENKNA